VLLGRSPIVPRKRAPRSFARCKEETEVRRRNGMAKVLIEGDSIDIRVSLLERVMLAERPRKLPLSRVLSVDPHPPLLDMMLHWSDQSGVWLCGVSAYDGHMIPSARHPKNTLAIEIDGEERERIYVEVDDESPAEVADRIVRALSSTQDSTEVLMTTPTTRVPGPDTKQAALMDALDVELDDEHEHVQLRDPLMQGSLPPPPMEPSEPTNGMKLDDDHDLTRMGGWLVALGSLGLVTGGIMLVSGALPGLLAVAAGVICAALGGVALAVVAHHQG
jgi:hypothetical protein